VVNPLAGSGRAGAAWGRLRARAEELAPGAAVVRAEAPGAAARELDGLLAAGGVERVVAVGGDGTVHFAVNRLRASGRLGETALGVVPAGTGSDLARTLGLPLRPGEALETALGPATRRIDLLEVATAAGVRLALNVASVGISGLVAGRVNLRRRRRPTVYLTATLRALVRYRPFWGRVVCDGETWHEGGVFLLAVANGPSFGRGMRVAPEAVVDDGLADVVVLRPMPRWQVPFRLPRLYTGTVLESPVATWCRARTVRLETDDPLPPFELDGETVPGGPAAFTVLPGALRVAGGRH